MLARLPPACRDRARGRAGAAPRAGPPAGRPPRRGRRGAGCERATGPSVAQRLDGARPQVVQVGDSVVGVAGREGSGRAARSRSSRRVSAVALPCGALPEALVDQHGADGRRSRSPKPVKSASCAAITTSAAATSARFCCFGQPSKKAQSPARSGAGGLVHTEPRGDGRADRLEVAAHRLARRRIAAPRSRAAPPPAHPRSARPRAASSASSCVGTNTTIRDGAPAAISRSRRAADARRAIRLLPRPTVARMPICGGGRRGSACQAAIRAQAACELGVELPPGLLHRERRRHVRWPRPPAYRAAEAGPRRAAAACRRPSVRRRRVRRPRRAPRPRQVGGGHELLPDRPRRGLRSAGRRRRRVVDRVVGDGREPAVAAVDDAARARRGPDHGRRAPPRARPARLRRRGAAGSSASISTERREPARRRGAAPRAARRAGCRRAQW